MSLLRVGPVRLTLLLSLPFSSPLLPGEGSKHLCWLYGAPGSVVGVLRAHFPDVNPETGSAMLRSSPQGDIEDLDADLDSPKS